MKEIICSLIWPLSCTLHVIIYIYASSFRETGTSLQSSLMFSCQISESFFHLPRLFDINFIAISIYSMSRCQYMLHLHQKQQWSHASIHSLSCYIKINTFFLVYGKLRTSRQYCDEEKNSPTNYFTSPSLLSLSILFSQTLISLLVISIIEQSIVTVLLQ